MSELTVEINTRNLETALRIFPKELKYELADGFDHISKRFLGSWRKARLKGPPGVMGHRQSGLFGRFYRACLVPSQSEGIEGMGMIVFTDSKVANLQESGGNVHDPSGGKIAVPLHKRTEMFTAEGHLKKQYKDVNKVKGLFRVMVKKSGETYLVKKVGRGKTGIRFLYVLKNNVVIHPRLGFYQTWEDMGNDRINILNQSIEKAIKETYF